MKNFTFSFIDFTRGIGCREDDSIEVRLKKQTLTIISLLSSFAGLIWGAVYILMGLNDSAIYPFLYSLVTALGITLFHFSKNFNVLLYITIPMIMTTPIVLQVTLGGFTASGVISYWAVVGPIGAILFLGQRKSILWFGLYLAVIITLLLLDPVISSREAVVTDTQRLILLGMNILVVSAITFFVVLHFVNVQQDEKSRNEELLKLSLQKEEIIEKKNNELERLSVQLSKYLSPQVYTSIFKGREVKKESSRKKLTVFFSDIQGFTSFTDEVESEDLTELLNYYLNEMSKIVLKHGGTIDKFIGDAIMVFFGDPETEGVEEDAYRCVSMAIEMREKMKELRVHWMNQGYSNPLRIRIGINTGYCTVGNFGSEDRMDYTIVGGEVNLASRLESLCEPDQILISRETFALVKNRIACSEKDEIKVKGIHYPVKTYQVIDYKEKVNGYNQKIERKGDGMAVKVDFTLANREDTVAVLKDLIRDIENIASDDETKESK